VGEMITTLIVTCLFRAGEYAFTQGDPITEIELRTQSKLQVTSSYLQAQRLDSE
jgi:hypothetical protein